MEHYLIIIEKGADNYSSYSPDLEGCAAAGKTIEDTIDKMREAIFFHIGGLQEQGETIPIPKPFEQHVNDIDIYAGDMFAFIGVQSEAIAA